MNARDAADAAKMARACFAQGMTALTAINGGLASAKREGVIVSEAEIVALNVIIARLDKYAASIETAMPAVPDVTSEAVK